MRLVQLLDHVPIVQIDGASDIEVGALHDDSRRLQRGDVFIAVRGATVDGHDFIDAATRAGASAVIVEHPVAFAGTQVIVENTARWRGELAANSFGRPADQMTLIGVTGTNGKTTTTFLTEAIVRHAGFSTGVIGTVTYRWMRDGALHEEPSPFTTPDPIALHALLDRMRKDGVTHVVMECSSHALAQDRLRGVKFTVAGFTNLTQDHLDFHRTMEEYAAAKRLLFSEHLRDDATAVILVDREHADEMRAAAHDRARVMTVSATARVDSDVHVSHSDSSLSGTHALLQTPSGSIAITSPLVGAFNLENLVVAIGQALALDILPSTIAAALADTSGAPGRLERVRETETHGFSAFVDYAHTPDALERVLAVVRPLTKGRLIAVFGCGGDRDRTKRPLMGAIAARRADIAIVTSDNPRTEDPQSIIDMIVAGIPDRTYVHIVIDRRAAIAQAVELARPGDAIVVAGKGHEDYQIIGKTKYPMDDRESVRLALNKLVIK